jgi:quercetin dioxygenase-like cupin family protein
MSPSQHFYDPISGKDTPEAKNLEALLTYQEDAIVSRTLIDKKKTGTVTFFAFDKDQGLSEHTAPFDAMVHVLDGEVDITISGNPFTLGKGDFIVMPANEPHALKAVTPFKMLLTMIRD